VPKYVCHCTVPYRPFYTSLHAEIPVIYISEFREILEVTKRNKGYLTAGTMLGSIIGYTSLVVIKFISNYILKFNMPKLYKAKLDCFHPVVYIRQFFLLNCAVFTQHTHNGCKLL